MATQKHILKAKVMLEVLMVKNVGEPAEAEEDMYVLKNLNFIAMKMKRTNLKKRKNLTPGISRVKARKRNQATASQGKLPTFY